MSDIGPVSERPAGERFLNRELSWLAFNERVLEEAENPSHPLLERVRFLSISASNLDEFTMVRVAGLKQQVLKGLVRPSADGLTPSEQLAAIREQVLKIIARQNTVWKGLSAELKQVGIEVVRRDAVRPAEIEWLHETYLPTIFNMLTPIAIDAAHPFPFIANLGFGLIMKLRHLGDTPAWRHVADEGGDGAPMVTALLQAPATLGRFVQLDGAPKRGRIKRRMIAIEDALLLCLEELFPQTELLEWGAFRLVRDSDLEVEEEAEDLISEFEFALKQRRQGRAVRLKIAMGMPETMKNLLAEEFEIPRDEIIEVDGLLALDGVKELIVDDLPNQLFPAYEPRSPERVMDYQGDHFAAIRAKDILVHHPYETFDVVVRFLRQAARDPQVKAIKQTLYRTSNDSPIVAALVEAAENGKAVNALVELKARFDEAANIRWAQNLERVGAVVVYGVPRLKVHAKLSMVVRQEPDGVRTYTHIGTGNYHPQTARVYTDLALFTANPQIATDANWVFNFVTAYARPDDLKHLCVAPVNLREKLRSLIETEIANAQAGKPAGVWAKMNSLVDPEMIELFYKASQAGVEVRLVVRGICCLRPGVKGMSENIEVRSIVGRFLEHSRVYCFADGAPMPSRRNKVYIGSADLMPRNIDHRVEVLAPILNETVHEQVLDQIMVVNLKDEANSWLMQPSGVYERHERAWADDAFSAHRYFMEHPSLSGRGDSGGFRPKPVSLDRPAAPPPSGAEVS